MSTTGGDRRPPGIEWIGDEDEIVLGPQQQRSARAVRIWLILFIVAVIAGGATWYALRPAPRFHARYLDNIVDNPAAVIAQTDSEFAAYVTANHGAVTKRSRCYFERIPGQSTEVAPNLYCGPVLFYSDAAPDLYLAYAVHAPQPANGHVTLSVGPMPGADRPTSVPTDSLVRPDHRSAPSGADGLVPPGPPPAPGDLLVGVSENSGGPLPKAPSTAFVVGRTITVRITAMGFVSTYRQDTDVYSAPPHERLLAFEWQHSDGEVGDTFSDPQTDLTLSIDGLPGRELPVNDAVDSGYFDRYVVAVPTDARSVDLVLDDGDITQRLSLLTGQPGKDNVLVLQRSPEDLYGRLAGPTTAQATVNDHGRTFTAHLTINLGGSSLTFFTYDPGHASGRDRALLDVDVTYESPQIVEPGSTHFYPFPSSQLTLTPTGGSPIRTRHDGFFDVPASFKSGTVTIAGTGTADYYGYTLTLAHPITLTVTFP